jgi:hypothetical protein
MITFEEFQKGALHSVDYGELGKKIIELRDNEELWKWIETQNYSEFEHGIVVGLMTAWIEIYAEK